MTIHSQFQPQYTSHLAASRTEHVSHTPF